MWRPKGWKNPFTECNKTCKKLYNGQPFSAVEQQVFEAGADAILEALENQTAFPQIVVGTDGKKRGYLVFIPDEADR